ncbi:MAG TPA: hypothetical protein VF868_00325 [Bacteroidia bacterium]|jgi:hypothetical protein
MRYVYLIVLSFFFVPLFSQTDSLEHQGTIRIERAKDPRVYIMASADFNTKGPNSFQPFPIVEGYGFPFNYSAYFREKFRNIKVDMRGKSTQVVRINITVSRKGRVTMKDVTYPEVRIAQLPPLNLYCFNFLEEIHKWFPAYDIDPQNSRYKGERVIKPVKTEKEATGVITIVFSDEPFD